uniref:Uncharacterized protein n=1 Tax=Romanomermis culicivorax TaxID=13658 RepID=A0A915L9T7_ROMCU
MPNHHTNDRLSNAQLSSWTSVDEIHCLQEEMARITTHIAKLMAKQHLPTPKPTRQSFQPFTQVQPISQSPSGA